MGYIDSHSDHSLYDIVDGTLGLEDNRPAETIEFCGFFIIPTSPDGGSYTVQYEGHMGSVMDFDADEYDDVLELVDDLIGLLLESHHYDYQDDIEGMVEFAGKMSTDDKEKAEENPDLYQFIPPAAQSSR